MKKIIYFCLGIISYIAIFPIIEEIVSVICGKLEVIKGKNTKEVLIINKEINSLQSDLEESSQNLIGFEIPNQEEEYFEEDY